MASNMKITQLSKDFNMKSKEVLDVFANELKIDKKSGATVDSDEFELFMQKLTLANQIKNIDAYLDGTVKLACKRNAPKAAPKAEEKKAEAAKAAEQKTAKKFCVNCGVELSDGMHFCVNCGASVSKYCV